MIQLTLLSALTVLLWPLNEVYSAQQQVQLSDSYLPVAMQVIAHLTDQMAFEVQDEMTPKPTTKPTVRPTTSPSVWSTTKPSVWSTTSRPYVTYKPTIGWWNKYPIKRTDITTPFHQPGLFAPFAPPKPSDRLTWHNRFVLLPLEQNSPYTILKPHETRFGEPLLAIHHDEIRPLLEPPPRPAPLLPPYDVKVSRRTDGYLLEDITEEQLQYLSEDVREMIKMARSPNDKVVDVFESVRQGPQPATSKAKLSSSNLRLLLLYDLLSRDAKKQRLSDYGGFSPDVMKALVASSSGNAREQLKMALAKMVERHDCGHDYANNRAKEMVQELGKDESLLSSELRNLQPLIYKY